MAKLDLKKELKELYFPSAKEPSIVEVPPMRFLMVDGAGDPNTSEAFQEALQALYGVAYTLKFALKKAGGQDFVVPPLEGLWWTDEAGGFDFDAKDRLQWTLMVMQPDHVTAAHVQDAAAALRAKRNPAALAKLRFERFAEGRCAQIMHLGPYAEEQPTIARLHQFIADQGCRPRDRHHEIYLSDPRRTKPERLKTVLRQPIV